MKRVSEPKKVTTPNAWGRDSTHISTTYEVEDSDVGRCKPNHLGFEHKDYTFVHSDVGRKISEMTSAGRERHFISLREIGWNCWDFIQ